MDVVGGCAEAGTRREATTIASRCQKQTPIEIGVPSGKKFQFQSPTPLPLTSTLP